jgi:hypothetical protein
VRVRESTPRRLATIKKDKAHLLLNCAGVLVRANIESDSAIKCDVEISKRGNLQSTKNPAAFLTAVAARPKKTQQHCFERGNFGSGHSPAIQERTKRPFDCIVQSEGVFVRVRKSIPRRLATIKKDKAHLLLDCAGVLVRANIENDSAIQRDPSCLLEILGILLFVFASHKCDVEISKRGNLQSTKNPAALDNCFPVRIQTLGAR